MNAYHGLRAAPLAALLCAATAAGAAEPLLVVHDLGTDADREVVGQRLLEQSGEDLELHWLSLRELALRFDAEPLEVDGAPWTSCKGAQISAQRMMHLAEVAFSQAEAGRSADALRQAAAAERRLACLGEFVPTSPLQRVALARAWAAHIDHRPYDVRDALREAAAVDTQLPYYATEALPEPLYHAFMVASDWLGRQPSWTAWIGVDGAPADLFIDGRLVAEGMGAGGTGEVEVTLAPGRHLLQLLRPGPRATSAVLELGGEAGLVRIRAVGDVQVTEVLQVFERSLVTTDPEPYLLGLLDAHPGARQHGRVALATVERFLDQSRPLVLPLARDEWGELQVDLELMAALETSLDRASEGIPGRRPRGPSQLPGRWLLRAGGSAGLLVAGGFVYGAFAGELGLETPVWIGVDLRPEVAVTGVGRGYVLGGTGAFLAFVPRTRRLRLTVGFGGQLRQPDQRFTGLRLHPAAEAGIGIELGRGIALSVIGEFTLSVVHDVATRIAISGDLGLGRTRGDDAGRR